MRCVGGQLKSHLNLTIGDNVQYSTLREHVLQWDRSQQKRATSMVASSNTEYQGPMPMDVDRVQDAKGKGENKVKMPRAKERKEQEIRKEKKVIMRVKAKAKAKARKAKVWHQLIQARRPRSTL